jgi:hypothetical protein
MFNSGVQPSRDVRSHARFRPYPHRAIPVRASPDISSAAGERTESRRLDDALSKFRAARLDLLRTLSLGAPLSAPDYKQKLMQLRDLHEVIQIMEETATQPRAQPPTVDRREGALSEPEAPLISERDKAIGGAAERITADRQRAVIVDLLGFIPDARVLGPDHHGFVWLVPSQEDDRQGPRCLGRPGDLLADAALTWRAARDTSAPTPARPDLRLLQRETRGA